MSRFVLVAVMTLLAWGAQALETSCTNALDDDADFLVDCDDGDCRLDAACLQSVTVDLDEQPYPLYPMILGSITLVSWPDIPVIPDVGGSDANGNNGYCAGDPGVPATGDGRIDTVDVLCSAWGWGDPARRQGALQISYFDYDSCITRSQTVARAGGRTRINGTALPFDRTQGYQFVTAPDPTGRLLGDNGIVLRGACDPAWTGTDIRPPRSCPSSSWRQILHLRFGGQVDHADEVLCGIEGIDWQDADGDGWPDTCTGGVFDGVTAASVSYWDHDPATDPVTDGHEVARTVQLTRHGIAFVGTDFPLVDGDAVVLETRPGQQPTRFVDPPAGRCP